MEKNEVKPLLKIQIDRKIAKTAINTVKKI